MGRPSVENESCRVIGTIPRRIGKDKGREELGI